MADVIDHAADVEARILKLRTSAIRQQAANQQIKAPTGKCFYCEEPVAKNDYFCDDDCAADYKKYVR